MLCGRGGGEEVGRSVECRDTDIVRERETILPRRASSSECVWVDDDSGDSTLWRSSDDANHESRAYQRSRSNALRRDERDRADRQSGWGARVR